MRDDYRIDLLTKASKKLYQDMDPEAWAAMEATAVEAREGEDNIRIEIAILTLRVGKGTSSMPVICGWEEGDDEPLILDPNKEWTDVDTMIDALQESTTFNVEKATPQESSCTQCKKSFKVGDPMFSFQLVESVCIRCSHELVQSKPPEKGAVFIPDDSGLGTLALIRKHKQGVRRIDAFMRKHTLKRVRPS
jgi:hypothetical protein